jgi:hypothetical protein
LVSNTQPIYYSRFGTNSERQRVAPTEEPFKTD